MTNDDVYDPPLANREKSHQYAIAALQQRRAFMSGELIRLERRRRYLKEAIQHLDATMGFMTTKSVETLKVRFPRRKSKLFGRGKLSTMILDTLRRAGRPMHVSEIGKAIAETLGYADKESLDGIMPCVRSALFYLMRARGLVVQEGVREEATWRLSSDTPY